MKRVADVVRRYPRFNIVAFTVTVLVAVAALEIADLWWRRDSAIANAGDRASNLTILLAEYVRSSFASADAAVRQLQVHGRRIGGSTASDIDWQSILDPARAGVPEIGSLTITDRRGTVTHSTVRAILGETRRDNYVFRELARSPEDRLVVDRPYLASDSQYIIPVGRRLIDDAGEFDGAAVATLLPENYRQFISKVVVGPRGQIMVLHPDGVVLFREPSVTNPINEAAESHPMLMLARQNGAGNYNGPLETGGPMFFSAYRTVPGSSLVVAVSLSDEFVFGDWRRQRRVATAAFGSLTVALGLIVAALLHVVSARDRAERELAAVQRLEAERLRESNEQLEAALERERRARQEVETASYMKDEFLMTVSHELRTPLTAIYGWARVLSTKEMPRDEQTRAFAAIERNAHAQTRLIDDLLDVSRAISGKLRVDPKPVSAADVVRAAVETIAPAIAAKSLRLETSFEPELPPIAADPDRLQQIVWNLLSNAIKFTPDGGSLRVSLARAGSHVELVVADSGAGMSAEFLPHVFERFRQEDTGTRRRYGGLGLGLAIVRHLVELHGGSVSAESPGEGRGATFRILLPLADE